MQGRGGSLMVTLQDTPESCSQPGQRRPLPESLAQEQLGEAPRGHRCPPPPPVPPGATVCTALHRRGDGVQDVEMKLSRQVGPSHQHRGSV